MPIQQMKIKAKEDGIVTKVKEVKITRPIEETNKNLVNNIKDNLQAKAIT